jgi:hypothetical protein
MSPRSREYYNIVKPDFGPDWQLRLQAQFMFPKQGQAAIRRMRDW